MSHARWNAPACLAALAVLALGCRLDRLLHSPDEPVPPLGPPARLAFNRFPEAARAGHPIGVQVTLQDSAGRPTAGDTTITVRLGANPGNARLAGDTTARPTNGVATFGNLRVNQAATGYTLIARYTGIPPDTSRAFAVAPDSATALAFTVQPSRAMQDSAIKPPVEVTAYDSLGNEATNFAGAVRLALGKDGSVKKNAKLAGKTLASPTAGVARFADLRIDRAGTGYTLTAAFADSAGAGAPVVESAQFEVTEPPLTATRLEVITQPPALVLRASPFQVQVAAVDDSSHIVSGFTGVVTIAIAHDGSPSQNARLGGATEAAVVNGIATFSDLSISEAGVSYTLRATTPDLAGVRTEAFDVVL